MLSHHISHTDNNSQGMETRHTSTQQAGAWLQLAQCRPRIDKDKAEQQERHTEPSQWTKYWRSVAMELGWSMGWMLL